jgi:hypothetical protein
MVANYLLKNWSRFSLGLPATRVLGSGGWDQLGPGGWESAWMGCTDSSSPVCFSVFPFDS